MTYGQYSLNNSLNYKKLNSFAGNNVDINKQIQDTANQSVDLAKQNPLGGAAVDTFGAAKENPVALAASMGGGLAVSAGLGVLYKKATWGNAATETPWFRFFNAVSENNIVKVLDQQIKNTGNFIKDHSPAFLKKGEIPTTLKNGLENFKGGQQELLGLHKELIEKVVGLSKEDAAKLNLGDILSKLTKGNENLPKDKIEKTVKDAVEKLSKSETTDFAKKIAEKLQGSGVADKTLHEIKGIANRVHILGELGKKGPITKALSDTSMFVSKMFGGNTIGIALNAVFMGQTVKAVIDAKPEDKHKVLAEEVAGQWIGTMLLFPVIEKGFNAVLNFRNIGLKGENIAKMAGLEKAVRLVEGADRGKVLKQIADVAKTADVKNIGLKALKTLGGVLSLGMNRSGKTPIFWLTAAARAAIVLLGLSGMASGACKKIANMITGAPPDKEKEAEAKKKAEVAKTAGIVNNTVKPATATQIGQPAAKDQPVKETDKEVKKEEAYVPSAYRDNKAKKSTTNSTTPAMAGSPQVLSALSRSDAVLKQAESALKNH